MDAILGSICESTATSSGDSVVGRNDWRDWQVNSLERGIQKRQCNRPPRARCHHVGAMMTPATTRFVTIVKSQELLGGTLAMEGASFASGYLAGRIAAVGESKGGDGSGRARVS